MQMGLRKWGLLNEVDMLIYLGNYYFFICYDYEDLDMFTKFLWIGNYPQHN